MVEEDAPRMPSKRALLLYAAAVTALPFAGMACAARKARAATVEVVIDDFAFRPAVLRVPPGTTVAWVNRDGSPHNVVSQENPRLFRSRLMEQGERFEFAFATPGTHAYYCALHPHMQGSIEVA